MKTLNIDKLKAEYQKLLSQKTELVFTYQSCNKEVRKLDNLNQYLDREQALQPQQNPTGKKTIRLYKISQKNGDAEAPPIS